MTFGATRGLGGADPRTATTSRLGRWSRLMLMLARRLGRGTLTIVTPDGTQHRFASDGKGPEATLIIRRERVAKRIFAGGDVPFAESYMDGDWDSPTLSELIELAALNADVIDQHLRERLWGRLLRRLLHALHRNNKTGSRRNIAYHYDLGNGFYGAWLDRGMTYSSALFAHPSLSLEDAQRAKYQRLAGLLQLRPEHQVLEIGCGWGGFIEAAVSAYRCRVTGITLSREQRAYALERLAKSGLAETSSVRL